MKQRELTIDRILQISNGISMAMGIEDLPSGVTTMRLGNLAEELRPHVAGFEKAKEQKRKDILKKQSQLDREKDKSWSIKHQMLDIEYADAIEELKAAINEDREVTTGKGKKIQKRLINCPEFKLSEFVAAEDFERVVSNGQGQPTTSIKIKKGQALLPPAFFTAMGDLIKE